MSKNKAILTAFSDTEFAMFLLALTTCGQIANGGQPSHQAMEILVSRRREFLGLTKKVDAALAKIED